MFILLFLILSEYVEKSKASTRKTYLLVLSTRTYNYYFIINRVKSILNLISL